LGRLEVGWDKMVFWSTKVAISLKRVKIEEKLLWGAYRNSIALFPTKMWSRNGKVWSPETNENVESKIMNLTLLRVASTHCFTGSVD